MANEIVIVIGFIFTIAAMCKVWNLYAMKQYSESKEKNRIDIWLLCRQSEIC